MWWADLKIPTNRVGKTKKTRSFNGSETAECTCVLVWATLLAWGREARRPESSDSAQKDPGESNGGWRCPTPRHREAHGWPDSTPAADHPETVQRGCDALLGAGVLFHTGGFLFTNERTNDLDLIRNCGRCPAVQEEELVDVDEETTTDDSTEEEPVDSSGDGEASTVEEEEQDDSAIGGGGSYEETDSEPLQDAIGGAISSAIDGFLMKALLGFGVIMGAGYAYENREEIKGYFKSVSKGKVA